MLGADWRAETLLRGGWSCIILGSHADVAELVDALASGASVRKYVKVQVLSSAPM